MATPNLSGTDLRIFEHKLGKPHATNQEIADALGLTRTTVSLHVNREPLRSALQQQASRTIEDAKQQLAVGASRAVSVLREVIDDPSSSRNDRIRAAKIILDAVLMLQRTEKPPQPGDERWVVTIGDDGLANIKKIETDPDADSLVQA